MQYIYYSERKMKRSSKGVKDVSKLKKIFFILMMTLLIVLLKNSTCQATAQEVLGLKENAVGKTVYTGGSELYNRWGNFENVYCARQDKTLNDGQNYNCQVVYYIELKGNEANFCNRTNPTLRPATGSGTDYRWGQLANILALGKNKGYRTSAGCTDTQYGLWYFLGTQNEWIKEKFGASWMIQSSYFTHARWQTTVKLGKSYSDKCANLAKNNSGYKGTVRIYWLEAKNQSVNQSLMIVELEDSKESEMILIDKQDSNDKSYLGGVSFKVKNDASGMYIKKADVVDEKNSDRYVYEVKDPSTSNTEYWTSDISQAMTFTTGTEKNYKGIQIKGIPSGTYTAIETSNPHSGYEGSINKTFSISSTSYEDYTNSNILYNTKQEQGSGNVKISGTVWEDIASNKENDGKGNSKKDSGEKGIEGVKVYWKSADGSIIASTTTGSDGSYTMRTNIDLGFCRWYIDQAAYNRINNSYVEFAYNGLTYTTVAYASNGDADTSKVIENSSSRTSLDNSFSQISNKGVSTNGSRLEYTYSSNPEVGSTRIATLSSPTSMSDFTVTADTKNVLSKYKFLQTYPALDTQERSGCIRHHYVSCSKHGSHHVCDEYGSKTVSWEISNVNCGLYKREQPDLAIGTDIEKVDVIMKGQQYTYKYGQRGLPDGSYKYDKVSFSDRNTEKYNRPVNPSDIAYINKDGNNPDDLQVYVTYNVRVQNQSRNLMAEVQEIVNYYDANYSLFDGNWRDVSKNGDRYNSNGFKAAYNQQLQGVKLAPGEESKTISLTLKVNNDVVKELIQKDRLFKNVSEIYMYSSYYGSNALCAEYQTASEKGRTGKQYAGIDKDSAPGNAEIKISNNTLDISTFEDDTGIAPTFMLIKADNYKQISGTVYEDSTTVNDNKRLGDGQNNGEKGVANVRVDLLKVNDDGSTQLADLYYIENGEAKTKQATTYTDANGHYEFGNNAKEGEDSGVVVDNYIVKYTYGNNTESTVKYGDTEEKELSKGETKVNTELKEGESSTINARDYKSTIITDNAISSVMRKNNDNNQEQITQKDLQWHLTKSGNTSIAVDDIDDLQWYFRNDNNELVKIDVNSLKEGSYDVNARLQISSLMNGNFNKGVNVSSYSLPFKVQLEYTADQESNVGEDGGNFDYNWDKFNFGIAERAREDIYVDKTIKNLKITLANGQVLTEGNPYTDSMDYVRALGSKDVINSREDFNKAFTKQREIFMEMDTELIQGATLELLYEITVTNNSEVDYEYDRSVIGGEGANYEKYYYYGEAKTNPIKQSVEYLVDYVDPDLVCEAGTGTANANWQKIEAKTLYDAGNISKEVYEGKKNDEGKVLDQMKGVVDGKYTILVTNAFKNLAAGESHSETLYASKLLATQSAEHVYENHTEIIQLNGRMARTIDGTNNGKQIAKTYIPGNYMPSTKARAAEETSLTRLHEQDDDAITVRITPPTGLENNAIIYISVGVIVLVLLAGGIYFIKRKTV